MEDKIEKTKNFIRGKLSGDSSGHDWWHTYRVWKTAVKIWEKDGGDKDIVELGALLHDVADYKLHGGDEEAGPKAAREWLESIGVQENTIERVCEIVRDISFKGAKVKDNIDTLEGKIVQDADRLDAMGAIGIARVFAVGAKFDRPIHDPEEKIRMHESFQEYKNKIGTTINHFYEKLLLLKDRMNTKTGLAMAENRHKFMEQYLAEFYKEWEGER